MADTPGGTVTKRIQLKVESGTPQLASIETAIGWLKDLNKQIVLTKSLSGGLEADLNRIFSGFGDSASAAASQVKRAMNDSLAATERVQRAVASAAKLPPIPGLGRLSGVNRAYASEGNFIAGDPAFRQEIYRSPGRTVKRSTSDNENFQYQESVNYTKFWDDAVKLGNRQKASDEFKAYQEALKNMRARQAEYDEFQKQSAERNRALTQSGIAHEAQRYQDALKGLANRQTVHEAEKKLASEREKMFESQARAHGKFSSGERQRDAASEFESGARVTGRGGNSEAAIEAQAAEAMRDFRINARLLAQQQRQQARQQAAFLKGRTGYSKPIGPQQPQVIPQAVMGGVNGYGMPIGPNFSGRAGAPAKPGGGAAGGGGGPPNTSLGALSSFAGKLGTAATWYAAYTAIHKFSDLLVYSFAREKDLELQTARLSQVFRGVGGDANQLADDTLKLAAAEGRSTDEAMASAIAWSRLGLTRREANEATKVSLMAANVAEISAADATQSLSSIMAGFNLQVSDLAPTLGILNQQSNTYRVTVAELLQGLSRVSGIAQQAGMSFAQLTGIMTVSAQKTGQTGVNMANALKTTLVRMNRTDVHEYFKERYGLNMTGTAGDLEKIWTVYSKVNKEQQRDILLKLAGATQANRTRAMLEGYSESVFAAVDSLTHLNSAELENLKITNTLSGATNRVKSSWDRLVSSTSSPGGLGGFTVGVAKGALNTTSGILAYLSGPSGGSGGQPKYFNPDLATGAGSLFGAANLLTLGAAGGFANGLYATFDRKRNNYDDRIKDRKSSYWASLGFTDTPTTQADFHNAEIEKINALIGRSEAGKDKADILEELAKNFNSFKPGSKKREMDVLSTGDRVSKDTLSKLAAGDTSGLLAEAEAARQDSQKAHRQEVLRVNANIADRERDLQNTPEVDTTKRNELEAQILELQKQGSRLLREDVESAKDEEQILFEVTREMAKQKEYAQSISDIFKHLGLNEYQQKLLTLQYQINATEQMAQAIQEKEPDAYKALDKKAAELHAELDALKQVSALDLVQRNAGVATRLATADVDSQGVGLSEGEKMLDRRRYIAQEMAKLTDLSKDSTNDLLRYEVLLNAARETQLDISRRVLEVDKERKQTAIDTQREFQKSLIGAGPGELLRKLAESQLAGKNGSRIRSAGQFFSLTGESQRDVYQLMGGERMASLNAEARVLRGRGMSVSDAQAMSDRVNTRTGEVGAEYGKRIFRDATVFDQVAKSLTNTSSAADRLAISFGHLQAKVEGLRFGGASPATSPTAPSATPVSQALDLPMSDSTSTRSKADYHFLLHR